MSPHTGQNGHHKKKKKKKTTHNECWRRYGRKGILLNCRQECRLVHPLWRTEQYGVSFKKLKIELPCDPAIPLLGIYPEKTLSQECTTLYIAALLTIVLTWKQLKYPSTEKWTKRHGTHMQWVILILIWPIKRTRIVTFAEMWMALYIVIQSEVS